MSVESAYSSWRKTDEKIIRKIFTAISFLDVFASHNSTDMASDMYQNSSMHYILHIKLNWLPMTF